MSTLKSIVEFLNKIMKFLIYFVIVFTMGVVTVSVFMRILFHSPISGIVDIVSMLSGLTVAFALSITEKNEKHVRVDFVREYFPPAISTVVYALINALMLGILGLILWRFVLYAQSTYLIGSQTWIMFLPHWPVVLSLAIGILAFLITALYNVLNSILHWKEAN